MHVTDEECLELGPKEENPETKKITFEIVIPISLEMFWENFIEKDCPFSYQDWFESN